METKREGLFVTVLSKNVKKKITSTVLFKPVDIFDLASSVFFVFFNYFYYCPPASFSPGKNSYLSCKDTVQCVNVSSYLFTMMTLFLFIQHIAEHVYSLFLGEGGWGPSLFLQ